MTLVTQHPVFAAIQPLLTLVGGEVLAPADLQPGDVTVTWEGEVIGGIRLESLSNALDRMVNHIEQELGERSRTCPARTNRLRSACSMSEEPSS